MLMDYISDIDLNNININLESKLEKVLELVQHVNIKVTNKIKFPYLNTIIDKRLKIALTRINTQKAHNFLSKKQVNIIFKQMKQLNNNLDNSYLIHGDFQNKNILVKNNNFTLINPIPNIGNKYYDITLWIATDNPGQLIDYKIDYKINYFKNHLELDKEILKQ